MIRCYSYHLVCRTGPDDTAFLRVFAQPHCGIGGTVWSVRVAPSRLLLAACMASAALTLIPDPVKCPPPSTRHDPCLCAAPSYARPTRHDPCLCAAPSYARHLQPGAWDVASLARRAVATRLPWEGEQLRLLPSAVPMGLLPRRQAI